MSAIDWCKSGFFMSFGKFMWTEALRPVPRLVGQVEIYPRWSSLANFAFSSILLAALASLVKTYLISDPFYIDIILNWSSSFTHTRNVLSLLWKIPLASGQSLSSPHDSKYLSPPLNKKWSATSYFFSSGVILARE